MRIEVSVPPLISDCTGGRTRFSLEADTLKEALDDLLQTHPLLRVHLFTETGQVRRHVILFYNDQNLAWLTDLDIPLQAGDRLLIAQAVSGG